MKLRKRASDGKQDFGKCHTWVEKCDILRHCSGKALRVRELRDASCERGPCSGCQARSAQIAILANFKTIDQRASKQAAERHSCDIARRGCLSFRANQIRFVGRGEWPEP